ncbi:hypothetical protein [Rhizobium sp. BK060]|uniref:hypothetical protein n=1 Tax=Rhizobium sp. BK060 TaxID=2587096 RepID=UPI00161DEC77|nr:hypothetical protein [Rhizobium sp. BK060]MBB3396155.1 hypothetical protein [Rhizobium sp. BK060]
MMSSRVSLLGLGGGSEHLKRVYVLATLQHLEAKFFVCYLAEEVIRIDHVACLLLNGGQSLKYRYKTVLMINLDR